CARYEADGASYYFDYW
nr:immunoglobulin heavy chain junction region [Macaca mulatta]MOX61044.1 immunoglobulin heavy chain junction region [Macaca mulatta]MOX65065.1 immunoglobulin heavy chain junction region [Macaca mulatta]MOX68643.1 immunoglobulin heavy chain junction region [Macaca mulatta]